MFRIAPLFFAAFLAVCPTVAHSCGVAGRLALNLLAGSSGGKVSRKDAAAFVGNLPEVTLDEARGRLEEVTRLLQSRLGTPLEVVPLGDFKADGFEAYRVTTPSGEFIFKILREDPGKAQRRLIRELAVVERLHGSGGLLGLTSITDAFVVRDRSGSHPALLMRKAPGSSMDAIVAGAAQGPEAVGRAEKAFAVTGTALAEFHATHSSDAAQQDTRRAAEKYRKQEHHDKFKRWFSSEAEGDSVVDSLVERGELSRPQAKALARRLKEMHGDAVDDTPAVTAIVHGDAKPGNFFYDPRSGKVTAIDLETMGRTLDRTGDPAEDVGRMLASMERDGVLANLDWFTIRKMQDAFLDAYVARSGKPPKFDERIRYYRYRYWGAMLGERSAKLNSEQRQRILEHLMDELEIPGPQVKALNDLLDAPYRDLEDLEFPSGIRLSVGKRDSKQMFALAVDAWKAIYDKEQLTSILREIADKPEHSVATKDYLMLKALRKRVLLLRGAFQAFDAGHEPPENLDEFARLFGAMNDALANGRGKKAADSAKELLKLVENKEPTKSLAEFKAASRESIDTHLQKLEKVVLEFLMKNSLLADDFHTLRKAIRQLQCVLRLKQASDPRPEIADALEFLHAANLETGKIHDAIVSGALKGQIAYDSEKVRVPPQLAVKLNNIWARLNIGPP